MQETILKKSLNRFTIFPIKYADLWSLCKKQEGALWISDEIDYSSDLESWEKLTNDEKFFIENVLAFFASADGIIMENISVNFADEVQIPEARSFYAIQTYIENVHSIVYGQLIETFVRDEGKKEKLRDAISINPAVMKKANWAMKWMTKDEQYPLDFARRLLAFAIVEGVFFSGSFCAIFWLKSRGLMVNALGHSNELIARDESLHCRFAIALYSHLSSKLSESEAHKIFQEAVEIEQEFITESLPCRLIGMNNVLMIQYIKFIADYWCIQFGYKKIFFSENPFNFMDMNSLDGKTNFFEKKVSEYRKAFSVTSAQNRNDDIKLDDDF